MSAMTTFFPGYIIMVIIERTFYVLLQEFFFIHLNPKVHL